MRHVPKIARVLVGVDFDDASTSALNVAAALADAWGADLTALHVATQDAPAYFTPTQIEGLEAEREQGRATTVSQVRAFAAHLSRDVRVEVAEGAPQDAMLRLATSFDLVVVGTHQRRGPRRWWLGSVAEIIVLHSPRPVLVVPAGAVAPDPGRAPTILTVGGAAAEAWGELLGTTFAGTVERAIDIHHCAPDRLHNVDLIVLSVPAEDRLRARFEAILLALKECGHPVLFVPSAEGMLVRSSS
jgi:nucleotide-binding universal stress UspA family protein